MRLRRFKYKWIGEGHAEAFIFSKPALLLLGLSAIAIVVVISSSPTVSNPFFALFWPLGSHSQTSGTPELSGTSGGPVAHVINGTYVGRHDSSYNQDYFLGIPYALPPTGSLRFRAPQPLNMRWNGARAAITYPNTCWSAKSSQSDRNSDGTTFSEDCLYLNIVRPSRNSDEKLPVAVWFHGGGFRTQKPSPSQFNLSAIVENSVNIGRPILAISFNYRLTGWGLLSSREMGEDTNLVLRDQRLALQWIHENIDAFGGDASKVTMFGVSAGASSIGFQLLAYGGRDDGLFRGAIMQSGAPIPMQTMDPNRTALAQAKFDNIAIELGCANGEQTLDCLRDVPAPRLNEAFIRHGGWFPIIDSDFIKDFPSKQLTQGQFVHVPTIMGATTDEGSLFADSHVENDQEFMEFVQNPSPRSPGAVLSTPLTQKITLAYPDDPCLGIPETLGCTRPPSTFGAQYRRSASYAGDAVIIANRRLTCQILAKSSVPTWSYRFNAHSLGRPLDNVYGVTHFEDVAFVFNNQDAIVDYMYRVSDQGRDEPSMHEMSEAYFELARLMSRSWAAFVHDQNPNSYKRANSSIDAWPSYDIQTPQNFVFDLSSSHPEPDTFRAEGIEILNGANDEYQR